MVHHRIYCTIMDPSWSFKFFAAVSVYLQFRHLTMIACHAQTNGQVVRLNKKIFTQLHQYVGEHQTDWDRVDQSLRCAYNTHVQSSTGMTHFCTLLSRHMRGPTMSDQPSLMLTDMLTTAESDWFCNRFAKPWRCQNT